MDDTHALLYGVFAVCFVLALVIWIIKTGVKTGIQEAGPRAASDLPGAAIVAEYSSTADQVPGRFRINGVDRATRTDTTWYVDADSVANARVKAELEGIIVTAIRREPPAVAAPAAPPPAADDSASPAAPSNHTAFQSRLQGISRPPRSR